MNNPNYCSLKRVIFFIILIAIVAGKSNSQWTALTPGTNYDLFSVYFINNTTGFIGSAKHPDGILPYGGEIFRTTNSGDNWTRVLYDTNFRVKNFFFVNTNTGFAVGGYYSTEGRIYKTTNAGLNWINITPPNQLEHLFNANFPDDLTGYICTASRVYKSTNGGNNWISVLNSSNSVNLPWGNLFFINVNSGFFVKDSGTVYRTVDGGSNWDTTLLNPVSYTHDIKFINSNTGFISGYNGKLFKTTNQGLNWFLLTTGNTQNLFSINFPDPLTGYVTGERIVIKTENAGVNWFPVYTQPLDTIISVFFNDINTGYISGGNGLLKKTTTGGIMGIQPVDPSVPVSYNLSQNYPNPFNPSTKIKFEIPKASLVKLSVFDALGRELESLVNETLQPGTYEVNWKAERLASGIYFYKLLANDFSMVKKMSLIK
jgi:photosystem II stability/assembly factor-like uncharacterized protein